VNRIFITGDMHGDVDIGKITKWKRIADDLDRSDILIVCGDMGFFWDGNGFDKYIKRYWEQQPFTVLWVDGNHENFDILSAVPVTEKWGGKVQRCAENVYHLCRGEAFTIYGKTFFTMGGANSIDKALRKEGISWWADEVPSAADWFHASDTIQKHGNEFDYILTHCAPSELLPLIDFTYEPDMVTNGLQALGSTLSWKKWFIGHYHMDKNFGLAFSLIYQDIIEL
jgi:hypothetical protein